VASATELINIPLNAGQREDINPKLLPQGLLRSATNVRLRKGGEIGVRHGFSALSMSTTDGGTLTAYDVVSHNDTLIAFGTTRGAGGPEKVFVWNEGALKWRGETHGARPRAFSAITGVRQAYRPPYTLTDEDQKYDVAYADGYLCLVYEDAADANVYLHVVNPTTGAVLYETQASGRSTPRVVGVGSLFVVAWQDTSDDVRCLTFNPSTLTLSAETVVHNTGTVGTGIDLCSVEGATEAMLLVVRADNATGTIYRLNTSLTTLDTATLNRTDVARGSIESRAGGTTNVAYVRTGGAYELESFDTATLTHQTGPTSLFGGSTGSRPPSLVRRGTSTLVVAAAIADTMDLQTKTDVRSDSTHVLSTGYTAREVGISSKLFLSADDLFCGALSVYGEASLVNFAAIYDVEGGRGFETAVHRGYSVPAHADWLGSVATDGTRHWAVFQVTDLACHHSAVVLEFKANSPERRQTASLGGILHVSGGFVGAWDGQRLVETGFLDAPVIESVTASNGAGTLTPSATYSWVAVREWFDSPGNRHLSAPSDPFTITMGASDDTATVVVSSSHSVRRIQGSDQGGQTVVYRTLAAPDRFYRRTVSASESAAFAQALSIVDEHSDADIRDQEVVYTQGARGSLSGTLQHDGAYPCEFLNAKRSRLLLGGLPDRSQWQQSKEEFPGEPITFSNSPGHFGDVKAAITGVATQDDLDYVFTRDQIFILGGQGPDDAGGSAEFSRPRELPGDKVGCTDARSIVVSSKGVWFRANPDRLMLIPRGGGEAAQWEGQPVRDTLAAFPVITSATVVSQDNTIVWAVENTEGDEGRLIVYDTRSGDWYVDNLTEHDSAPVQAACEHLGRLVLVIDGEVHYQNTGFVADTFIPYEFQTACLAPSGTEGWTKLVSFTSTCTSYGDCTVDALISYEDGADETSTLDSPYEIDGLDVGQNVGGLQFWPYRRKGSRFSLKFRVDALGDEPSAGVTFSALTLEVQKLRKTGRKRNALRK
jgi:hypothetical protein